LNPIARLDALTLVAHGVDASSGKPWYRFACADAAATALRTFTAEPEGRSVVVVVDGEVAAHHKIREPVSGTAFQVSCCNPAACDRWISNVSSGQLGPASL
jgi:preprotein translocase subunit SecD